MLEKPTLSSNILKSRLLRVATGLVLATGAVAGISKLVSDRVHETMHEDTSKKSSSKTPTPTEALHEKELSLEVCWENIQKKFPNLIKAPNEIFATDDPEIYAFLKRCSLDDLKKYKILKSTDQIFVYMNTPQLWKDSHAKKKKKKLWTKIEQNVLKEKEKSHTLAEFHRILEEEIDALKALREAEKLDTPMSSYVTSDTLLAIAIQEVAPSSMGEKNMTPQARFEIYRMMREAGWQPEKVPAMHDASISFGNWQMALGTHKGLQGLYGKGTSKLIKPNFANQTTAQQQAREMYLLALSNMKAFTKIIGSDQEFVKIFNGASEEEKGECVAMIMAAYHNCGNGKELRSALKTALTRTLAKKSNVTLAHFMSETKHALQDFAITGPHVENTRHLFKIASAHFATFPPPDHTEVADK